jgi:hypothetical protein
MVQNGDRDEKRRSPISYLAMQSALLRYPGLPDGL